MTVYEVFFKSFFMDKIHTVVAKIYDCFKILHAQLNPLIWRTLVVIQICEFRGITMVVNKVLFSYYLTPLFGGENIFFFHSKSCYNVVEELSKVNRKCHVFEKKWSKKIFFYGYLWFYYLPVFCQQVQVMHMCCKSVSCVVVNCFSFLVIIMQFWLSSYFQRQTVKVK